MTVWEDGGPGCGRVTPITAGHMQSGEKAKEGRAGVHEVWRGSKGSMTPHPYPVSYMCWTVCHVSFHPFLPEAE